MTRRAFFTTLMLATLLLAGSSPANRLRSRRSPGYVDQQRAVAELHQWQQRHGSGRRQWRDRGRQRWQPDALGHRYRGPHRQIHHGRWIGQQPRHGGRGG